MDASMVTILTNLGIGIPDLLAIGGLTSLCIALAKKHLGWSGNPLLAVGLVSGLFWATVTLWPSTGLPPLPVRIAGIGVLALLVAAGGWQQIKDTIDKARGITKSMKPLGAGNRLTDEPQ